jgi:hypothetical protein
MHFIEWKDVFEGRAQEGGDLSPIPFAIGRGVLYQLRLTEYVLGYNPSHWETLTGASRRACMYIQA